MFIAAPALDVAMTARILVAIAWCIGSPKTSARKGIRKTPPPRPSIAPIVPARPPPRTRRRKETVDISINSFVEELNQDNKKSGEFQ
jgi:hypothetical protein